MNGKRRWRGIALCVALLLLVCRERLDAQLADAEVHVRVAGLNPASADRPVIVFERRGKTSGSYMAPASANDDVIFPHLPAGSYRLRISVSGSEIISQPVDIRPGEVLLVTVTAPGAQSRGTGPAVNVERHPFSYGIVFDDTRLQDLPNSDHLWPLIETAEPFTFSDRLDTGGLSTATPQRLDSHASSWTQTSFQVDGLDITDLSRGGTPLLYPDLDAFTAVNVTSGSMPVEVGPAGPAVTLVPRRPTRTWVAELASDWTPGAGSVSAGSSVPAIERLTSWSKGHVLVSGPLVKNRVGMLVSSTIIRSNRQERDGPVILPGDVDSIFAHVVVTPPRPYELRLIAGGQRLTRPFAGRALFQGGNAAEDGRQLQLQGTWEARPGSGAFWRIAGGYQRSSVTPQLAGLTPANAIERLHDGPVPELAFASDGTQQRWTTTAAFEPRLMERDGRHHIRFGVTLSGADATTRPDPPGLTAELVGGLPARVWDYHHAGPVSRWRETILAGYAADRLMWPRVAMEAGARVEMLRGRADGAPEGVTWTSVSPRVSLRWSPLVNHHLTVIGGYGRYQWQLPLVNLSFGDATAARGNVYRWLDANDDGVLQSSEVGPLIARVGPGSFSNGQTTIDAGLRRTYTDEFIVGVESRPTPSLMLRFAGIARRDRRLMASVNVGVPSSSYDVGTVPDPGGDLISAADDQLLPFYNRLPSSFGEDRELLTNPGGLDATFEGLELTVEKTLTKRFQMLFGATATQSDGPGGNRGFHVFENDQGVVGELLTNPNAETFARHNRQFFERGFSIKVSGSYHAPGDVRIGAAARYQDGQPFARIVIVPDLNQGAEAIQAFPNGRSRFTYTLTVDARVEKRVVVRSIGVGFVFEAFNLLNLANEVEEDPITGPGFRTITAVQPPRVIRLGLRVFF